MDADWRRGLRAGIPFAVASGVLALSFGVVARDAGFSAIGADTAGVGPARSSCGAGDR